MMKTINNSLVTLLCAQVQLDLIQAAFEWDRKNPWVQRGEGGRFGKGGSSKASYQNNSGDAENVFKSIGDRLVNSPSEISALVQEQSTSIKDSLAAVLPPQMAGFLKSRNQNVKSVTDKPALLKQFDQWNKDYESLIKDLNSEKGKSKQEAIAGKALAAAIPCLVLLAAAAGGGSLFKAASKGHAGMILETAIKSLATGALVNQQLESHDVGNPLTRLGISAASAFGAGTICKMMLKQQGVDIGKGFKAKASTKPVGGKLNARDFETSELKNFSPGSGTSKFFKTSIDDQEYFVKEIGKDALPNINTQMAEHAEVLSHEIGKMLGLDNYLVPTTSFVKDGKKYVASPMLDGEPLFATRKKKLTKGKASDQLNEILDDADIKKIAAFDFLIRNTDRHTGNIFVTDKGIKLIDHELSFNGFQPDPLPQVPSLQGVMRYLVQNRSKTDSVLKYTQQEVDQILGQKQKMLDMAEKYFKELQGVDEIEAKLHFSAFKKSLDMRMDVFQGMIDNKDFSASRLLGMQVPGLDGFLNMIVNR